MSARRIRVAVIGGGSTVFSKMLVTDLLAGPIRDVDLVLQARAAGAEAWLVNAEPPDNAGAFHHFVRGPSGRILPDLLEWAP